MHTMSQKNKGKEEGEKIEGQKRAVVFVAKRVSRTGIFKGASVLRATLGSFSRKSDSNIMRAQLGPGKTTKYAYFTHERIIFLIDD